MRVKNRTLSGYTNKSLIILQSVLEGYLKKMSYPDPFRVKIQAPGMTHSSVTQANNQDIPEQNKMPPTGLSREGATC